MAISNYDMMAHQFRSSLIPVDSRQETQVPMHSPLERLKGVAAYLKGCYTLAALLELSAYGKGLEAEYKEHGIPVPKWLPESLRALKTAIAETWRREREEKLRKAEAELEELQSKEEKRIAKAEEVERLRKELGYGEGEE